MSSGSSQQEIKEFLSSTMKLLVLVAVVSLICGAAYGWPMGTKFWVGSSAIVVLSQLWGSHHAIKAYWVRRCSAKESA